MNTLKNHKGGIINLGIKNGIVGTNGRLERYPKIDINGVYIGGSKAVITRAIGDIGFEMAIPNDEGKMIIQNVMYKDAIKIAESAGVANAKVVNKENCTYICPICGEYDQMELDDAQREQIRRIKGDEGEKASAVSIKNSRVAKRSGDKCLEKPKDTIKKKNDIRRIVGTEVNRENSKLRIVHTDGMTVEQKMLLANMVIKDVRPFYSAILRVIKKIESTEVNTAAVSVDKLYYNADFVSKLRPSEVVFLLLHEVSHIAFNHLMRERHRDHERWNIACDLYINKVIADEFGI